jgi:hypothetical protein
VLADSTDLNGYCVKQAIVDYQVECDGAYLAKRQPARKRLPMVCDQTNHKWRDAQTGEEPDAFLTDSFRNKYCRKKKR